MFKINSKYGVISTHNPLLNPYFSNTEVCSSSKHSHLRPSRKAKDKEESLRSYLRP